MARVSVYWLPFPATSTLARVYAVAPVILITNGLKANAISLYAYAVAVPIVKVVVMVSRSPCYFIVTLFNRMFFACTEIRNIKRSFVSLIVRGISFE